MLRQFLRGRDGEGDSRLEGRVGAGAPACRGLICALGSVGAESCVSGGTAERLRTEEQLAGSGVGWGSVPLRDAVFTGSLALGRQRSSGASERVCEGRVRQPG